MNLTRQGRNSTFESVSSFSRIMRQNKPNARRNGAADPDVEFLSNVIRSTKSDKAAKPESQGMFNLVKFVNIPKQKFGF